MALNAQQKRVSKNRVSITYDVEDGGAKQTKELPFVIGMIGGYSGDREDREALHERTFYNVDKDNFDQVLKRVGPKVSMKVDNLIENDGTEMAVEINFASMKDFGPDSVVQQVEPLRKLAETREQLMSILAKSEKSRDLENILKEVLQNADALKSLSDDLGVVSSEESK